MNISNRTNASAVCAALCIACVSNAQTKGTFLLTSSNTVSPATPTTTIEIWASWDAAPGAFTFGAIDYDITASDGVFSDPINILNGAGSSAGVAIGNTIVGGLNGKLYIFVPGCGFGGCPPETEVLLASYTWTNSDFTPRTVDLVTSNTSRFTLFDNNTGAQVELYPNDFKPGKGVITVVPSPASWLVFALPVIAARRRRG